ncbi:hypothetical protein BFP72_03000 [Reichenbachiella sp. 5M10]|uniref:YchJ family protein n=1 Tax=Reichenbachiella sp. 5M10 TaxID=1889772 RepID=UPI000C14F128|nr:YchJ family protein [Reichenbachiella sp. 5M10]PIB34455.1 hypothetical protein BFP72_03000 [Reichenbachiella sp. 5M10]
MKCPCCSKKTYAECCEPIILQQSAPTALALMRSRYTAYAVGQANYLYQTTHASKRAQQTVDELAQWSTDNTWTKLEIIAVEHGRIHDSHGIVEFKAYFADAKGLEQVLHERSSFLQEEDGWYYVDGVFDPEAIDLTKKVSRNDPCPCGSGKKYKKCCA